MIHAHKNFESMDPTIKGIAWMSFFWSVSTLMVFSVLHAFLVDELKMGHSSIGVMEGLAISASFFSKFFSGYLSDVLKKRKPLIIIGTVLNAVTKSLFALCSGAGLLFIARFSDRLSKGIRSAPTDALIADLSDSSFYASNFGYRQALYTLGQVVGATLAIVILVLSGNNYRLLFALAVVPAVLAVIVLWFFIKPNPKSHPRATSQFQYKKIRFTDFKKMPLSFWWLMLAFFFLMMARFSEAFLTLKGKDIGFSIAYLPAIMVIMDLVHSGIAWPAGNYADRFSRNQVLVFGLTIMIAAQTVLAYVTTIPGMIFGIILVGIHMGITQGLLRALVAEATPPELRGTAFSLFFMVSGFALFLGNVIAGNLSQHFGLYATFLGGATFTLIAVIVLFAALLRQPAARAEKLSIIKPQV